MQILENEEIKKISLSKPVDIVEYFSKLKTEQLAYYFYKTKDEKIKLYKKFNTIELKISGNDLIKLNYPKGKLFGEILNNLLNQKMLAPDLFKTIDDEINWVLKHYPL